MARYFQMANLNFAVWDRSLDSQTPDAAWTLIATYDETLYAAIHQQLSDNVKNATWNAGTRELTIDSVVVIDGAWIDARAAELATAANVVTAQSGLKDKISLAQDHAPTIKTLFNAVLDQTINQTVQPARFDTLKAIVVSSPQAFRDRVVTDIQQELGFDVTGSLTLAQQRQSCLYLRMWITGLALLLSEA